MTDFDKISRGFDIFRSFTDDKNQSVSAQHDVIYAGPNPIAVPDEIKAQLEELGWHPDNELECFYYFT